MYFIWRKEWDSSKGASTYKHLQNNNAIHEAHNVLPTKCVFFSFKFISLRVIMYLCSTWNCVFHLVILLFILIFLKEPFLGLRKSVWNRINGKSVLIYLKEKYFNWQNKEAFQQKENPITPFSEHLFLLIVL